MADTAPTALTFKKRTNKSTNIRKRPATPAPAADSGSSASDLTDEESDMRVKRRKREGLTTTSAINRPGDRDLSKSTKFAADRNTAISENQDATRASTWYTDSALKGTTAATPAAVGKDGEEAQDGTYKGTTTYGSFIQKHPDRQAKTVGPVKAPTNVRAITVTDFAPDVCKDYKQTGFCGFGDSCKFLHAREDYKQGWQLDKEWERAGKSGSKPGAKPKDTDLDDEEKLLRDIPFKCIICKGDYKMPMVTKCGHYFCEKCCMTRYMKEKKKGCAQCGADTHGSFGVAKKLKALLEKKKVREEEREAKEAEES